MEKEQFMFNPYFRSLNTVYIPSTIERIGKKAFNSKHLPTFNMPPMISRDDLAAGRAVHPQVEKDMMADFDYSDYTDEATPKAVKTVAKAEPTVKKVTPGQMATDATYLEMSGSPLPSFLLAISVKLGDN